MGSFRSISYDLEAALSEGGQEALAENSTGIIPGTDKEKHLIHFYRLLVNRYVNKLCIVN